MQSPCVVDATERLRESQAKYTDRPGAEPTRAINNRRAPMSGVGGCSVYDRLATLPLPDDAGHGEVYGLCFTFYARRGRGRPGSLGWRESRMSIKSVKVVMYLAEA